MADATNKFAVHFSTTLVLNETEIRALDALVGYGDDAFLAAFKEKLGAAYIRDHESGLRSAFDAIRRDVLPALRGIDQVRKDLRDVQLKRFEAAQEARKNG
ncbi:hypothetical protein AncyloWKF20_05335 [Ancylobacter sp. WKF20]|uniref:hypothetical protein n=1 Tax=Ancylobacter sp. WKF20 TaxID=3039801 RepID=UPI00243449CA|nr:hypothetical protein [Ancylobacter sp. WKF20]WGD31248.1 hypothetical protein AncyloWKF20_05335 [Ancylobacter sp. WKF20]